MQMTKLVALAMLALAACSPDASPSRVIAPEAPSFSRGVSKLWIDPATLTLRVGETVTITAWAGKRVSTQSMLLWGCQEMGCNTVIAIASPASGPTVSQVVDIFGCPLANGMSRQPGACSEANT